MMAATHDLDLTKYHAKRTFGDVTVFFTWITREQKPCMVLAPTHRLGIREIIPCVILMDRAWLWSEEIGDGAHCARSSAEFAANLGLPFSVNSAMRVASIIRECLDDLIKIPPRPDGDRIVVGEMRRVDHDTGKIHESEIIENV